MAHFFKIIESISLPITVGDVNFRFFRIISGVNTTKKQLQLANTKTRKVKKILFSTYKIIRIRKVIVYYIFTKLLDLVSKKTNVVNDNTDILTNPI